MIKTLKCPCCDKFVEPIEFQLFPGASVNVCPTCRIGIGDVDEVLAAGYKAMKRPRRDKMVRRAKRTKAII